MAKVLSFLLVRVVHSWVSSSASSSSRSAGPRRNSLCRASRTGSNRLVLDPALGGPGRSYVLWGRVLEDGREEFASLSPRYGLPRASNAYCSNDSSIRGGLYELGGPDHVERVLDVDAYSPLHSLSDSLCDRDDPELDGSCSPAGSEGRDLNSQSRGGGCPWVKSGGYPLVKNRGRDGDGALRGSGGRRLPGSIMGAGDAWPLRSSVYGGKYGDGCA